MFVFTSSLFSTQLKPCSFFVFFCFFMNQSPTVRPKCFVTHLIRVLSAQFEFPWLSPRGTVKAYVFWRLTSNLSTGRARLQYRRFCYTQTEKGVENW